MTDADRATFTAGAALAIYVLLSTCTPSTVPTDDDPVMIPETPPAEVVPVPDPETSRERLIELVCTDKGPPFPPPPMACYEETPTP